MARLAPIGRFRAFTNAGLPLSGGKLYTYEAGTTTPKTTYTDADEGTANANPVELDANGYADVWLDGGAYKFVLKDSTDATLWTVDDISSDEARSFGYTTATFSTTSAITTVYDNYFIICTATLTLNLLPAASAGDGFFFVVKNTGSGTVTIDPSDAETIDGASTTTIVAGGSAIVQCNGSSWQTICKIGDSVPFTAASASGAASLQFAEDTDNGTNKITLKGQASLASDIDVTLPSTAGTLVGTGDTSSVSTAMIADDAVTYAKLQNVSAQYRLLGRSSSGAGDAEEITTTSYALTLLDDADASTARTTLGFTGAIVAWINFNGSGTPAARGSGNVTSITDGGTGLFTINFTSSISDANYAAVSSASNTDGSGTAVGLLTSETTVPTASACKLVCAVGAAGNSDRLYLNAVFVR